MKKKLLLLGLSLWIPICTFSQNIYPQKVNDSLVIITASQLKQTNLIFLDRTRLKLKEDEYIKQIDAYKQIIDSYNTTDSIRNAQLVFMRHNYNTKCAEVTKLKTSNRKLKTLSIIGLSVGLGGFIFGVLK